MFIQKVLPQARAIKIDKHPLIWIVVERINILDIMDSSYKMLL